MSSRISKRLTLTVLLLLGCNRPLECNSAPNGVCLTQAMAAAKVPPTDFNNASLRFFNINFPSGHASQEIVCNNKCLAGGGSCTAPPNPWP